DDSYTPSCSSGGPDQIFRFAAPEEGHYIVDTKGSDYNTVLVALAADCTERACNDDANGTPQSRIELDLNAGELVYLLVDGSRAASGSFPLNVGHRPPPPACISSDLGSTVPQTVQGTAAGRPDGMEAPCGDPGGPDDALSFTAPSEREYTFDTFRSD